MKFNDLIFTFLKELNNFQYETGYAIRIWNIIFPVVNGNWYHLRVVLREHIFYISHVDGNTCPLEADTNNKIVNVSEPFYCNRKMEGSSNPDQIWTPIIKDSMRWIEEVKSDWIKSYKYIHKNYPFNNRYGTINSKFIRGRLEDYYCMNKELRNEKVNQFVELVESEYFENLDKFILKDMTANDYFSFCKIAYISYFSDVECFDRNLSGYEMYQNFSDGRHNGLLDINFDSKKEFSSWLNGKHPKFQHGGHPWEIIKGYSSININMFVERPDYWNKSGYRIRISASESCWVAAAVKMFLALYNAGIHVLITDYNEIRERLLDLDNIGIVPEYESTLNIRSNFSKTEKVYEVIHYDELENHKQILAPFINWKPLPILKPID